MKKVCHITTVHPLLDTRIFYKECQTLARHGYDVSLIVQHDEGVVIDGVKIIPLPKPKNRFERFFSLSRKAYKLALNQKADVYHFHDPEILNWMVKLKKKTGAKLIYDIHENISEQILDKEWIPKFLRNFVSIIYKWREKKSLPFIDQVLVAEDSYLKIYKDCEEIEVIRNYPLISNQLLLNKVKIKYGSPKLVYVGGVSRARGVLEMIQVVKILRHKFKGIQLKIAGSVEGEIKFEINNLIKYLKLNNNVIFCGRIPHPEALQLISEGSIGLSLLHPFPNYVESLPTKLFEYMTAGIPVVTSNFPLWEEIVEVNSCGICVNPLDPKEIAEAIEYLINHPEESREMGENGRKAVLEKYNWENESKKLLKVYETLTNK